MHGCPSVRELKHHRLKAVGSRATKVA